MSQARYILIGGFLGAGKTTAMLRLARELSGRGLSVGLITNDQSTGLVDTALAGHQGFATSEVTGGCFCCKFGSLMEAAEQLAAEARPDVFLAEPVGSCTDLKATVSYPLRRLYGERYCVAPLTVLADPVRAERVLGLEAGPNFSAKVLYVYRKQLEEAEIIAVNKCDLLDPARLDRLESALRAAYPERDVLRLSAREGMGIPAWLDRLVGEELGHAPTMDVDYDTYAEGEALLGWLNATVRVAGPELFDGNALVRTVGERVCRMLGQEGIEVAHFKMTLAPEVGRDLAVANLVGADQALEMPYLLADPLAAGVLTINLRAEADPERLAVLVRSALHALPGLSTIEIDEMAAFRPGRPMPTHRLVEA